MALVATALLVGVVGPSASAATAPSGLTRFREAVGQIESGGRYTARNPVSGAYGKYQIMPSNWPSWAGTYLGNPNASWSPSNQDRVASGKMTSLYRWLGSWKRVAYWWLTGSSKTSGWTAYATDYVRRVMAEYHGSSTTASSVVTARAQESNSHVTYTGTWKPAEHAAYAGDRVLYATKAGASAEFTFTGRRIAWYGPKGPTRGKAKVYVDGQYVRTVDLLRSSFLARASLFSKGWSEPGEHTIRIVVVGTKGRPMVAIDEFVITR